MRKKGSRIKKKNSTNKWISRTELHYSIPDVPEEMGLYDNKRKNLDKLDEVVEYFSNKGYNSITDETLDKAKEWHNMRYSKYHIEYEILGWYHNGFAVPHLFYKMKLIRKDKYINRLPAREFKASRYDEDRIKAFKSNYKKFGERLRVKN